MFLLEMNAFQFVLMRFLNRIIFEKKMKDKKNIWIFWNQPLMHKHINWYGKHAFERDERFWLQHRRIALKTYLCKLHWEASCFCVQSFDQGTSTILIFLINVTRKYPLCRYILGVLKHTTAWDQLWRGDVFLKMYIRSSALPRIAVVWLGFWNSDHVVLKLSIRSSASPRSAAVWLAFWNSDHVVLKSSIRSSASPRLAAVWLASGTMTRWFWNWAYVAWVCLAQQQSDWAFGTLNMINLN